jgi:hypothetical protein
MKKIFTLILILAIGIVAYAEQNMQDVVYLKNGTIVRGVITEQVPNQSINIQTGDNIFSVYRIDEIEKMTKEDAPAMTKSGSGSNQEYPSQGFSLGMKVGVNMSTMSNLDWPENYDNMSKIGFLFGFLGEYRFNKYLGLQMELLYSPKGLKVKATESGVTVKVWESINYLEIPLLIKGSIPAGPVVIYGNIGPYLGIGLTAKIGSDPDTGDFEDPKFEEGGLSRIDFGLCFGAGVGFKIKRSLLFLDLRYGLGLTDVNDIADADKGDNYKKNCNRNFGIAIGYSMPLGK